MGTTILSFKYDGGIIVCADGRTSNSMYINNNHSDKLEPIHDRIYAQRSGTAGDTQTICRYVRHYLDIQAGEMQAMPPVKSCANIMK
jgi:20S proteasome subunit beta 1